MLVSSVGVNTQVRNEVNKSCLKDNCLTKAIKSIWKCMTSLFCCIFCCTRSDKITNQISQITNSSDTFSPKGKIPKKTIVRSASETNVDKPREKKDDDLDLLDSGVEEDNIETETTGITSTTRNTDTIFAKTKGTPTFIENYVVMLNKQKIEINSLEDQNKFVDDLYQLVYQVPHDQVTIKLPKDVLFRKLSYTRNPLLEKFEVDYFEKSKTLILYPKMKSVKIEENQQILEFIDGTVLSLLITTSFMHQGTGKRVYPDGTVEEGKIKMVESSKLYKLIEEF